MKVCRRCHSTEIEFIPQHKHECVETNHEVVHDVYMCKSCGAFCYKEGTYDIMEYTPDIIGRYKYVPQVSDYDVILAAKRKADAEKEKV